ncbi:MAG: glycosyltransferase [Alphaproteobacteria bacterium]|nr:glycosyltransferase [Alphaproteobacteria bacterium]MBU1514779.1 glycosyltransferase [Alphaproteobacteria bacterium]MBU2093910.1 glycosyltransferase [Alphaproteobacteria bacterium]MBU2153337.1 glycosyltransferase [Alphaproteobacteria bacterium]MBU2309765.1 glycosyltransferase [Alphaproteobacteria bacterium]
MRFVLIKGQSQYGSLRLHIDQFAEALRQQGHEVRVVDMMAGGQAELNETTTNPPDCYFAIGGVAGGYSNAAGSIYDQLGVVYATLHVDHPVHQIERVTTKIRKHAAFFLDRTHVQFVSAWPAAKGLAHLGFMPPGANELPEPVDTSDEAFARRDIPLLFTGTYRGPPQAAWASWDDSPAKAIVGEIAGRMADDARLPVLDALKASLADRGGTLSGDLFDQFVPLLQPPQAFAEAFHRDRLLHALGRAGVPMHVYGNGWEPLVAQYPSFTYGGVGSFEETLHLLRRARLVLNTNNGFVSGGHERVFTAMCAGAAVFSDASKYYADAFKEGREIATFDWRKLDAAPAQLLALMDDTPALAAMARAGHKRAMAEHRWSDRAARVVKAVKQIR